MNKTLALFIGCFLLPVAAAVAVLKFDLAPSSTTNYGRFLENEVILPIKSEDKMWTIVLNLPAQCQTACEVQRENAEQLKVALGKHSQKVSVVLFEETYSAQSSGSHELAPGAFYLVDKHGLVVLEYLYQANPESNRLVLKGLLKDMKKLLNYARSK
ncbi:transmembrane cytochrome oxidase associated protein [Pseudoalteromonas sp. SMS1]|uniref:transmembrane cytochrome oxidase associated protein n=1 Tax=Pseudoalteromonas sp. SMS1 TaxID=2908894 RepID=UPI001F23572E|nr:transmembrane cytochrome oxidase associated protein [Pseudoalteromonas sp. SMS1]MCF2859629.1 transmembrane cytochrome oxidase associated protein [Pseudoalteromonas sp. SMS1]